MTVRICEGGDLPRLMRRLGRTPASQRITTPNNDTVNRPARGTR